MTRGLTTWLRDRARADKAAPGIAGGPSFAYVAGWVLVLLLGVEAITGAALAAFYAPSSTSAWASVAYVQDQMPLGWLVRGLHYHGGSAIVIVAGLHLVQTAIYGAYKKPRELVWWLGIVLLLLVLGFAISGYVLRWDQSGYWANRVEVGIAASTPVVGSLIRSLAIGGNEYGNLTLTRFYALHVVVLPGIVALGTVGHIWLSRRHGTTPRWGRDGLAAVARWPQQTLRNVIAMAVVFAILLGYVIAQHGADLAAPADPAAAYDARPLWYFRWLFELRHLAGSYEKLAALAAPAIVGGFLVGLPLVDRDPDRSVSKRRAFVISVLALFAIIGALTLKSFAGDASDPELAKREQAAQQLADRTRALAATNGVPVTGGKDIFTTIPMYTARSIYEAKCKSCHDAQSKDRKGPVLGAGLHDRAWLTAFLKNPAGDAFWGKTKLGPSQDGMKPVELADADLRDVVEALYAQTGARDIDQNRLKHGQDVFKATCTDCHSLDEGVAGGAGPGLGELGSRDWFTSVIGNPKKPIHMGSSSEMPRFDQELTIVERDQLAGYLEWLRTATPADVARLPPVD